MIYFSIRFSRRMRSTYKESRHQLGELNAQVEDTLSGIRVVKSFANEELEKEKFAEGNRGFLRIKRMMYHNMAGFHSVTRLFDGLMFIVVVLLGALFLIRGEGGITAADYIASVSYTHLDVYKRQAGKAAALAGGAGNAVHHRLPPAGDEVGHRAGAPREVRLFRAGAARCV